MEELYNKNNIELEISQGYVIRVHNEQMEISKKDKCIVEDSLENFVLTWYKAKKELGCDYLDILFYHPSIDSDFQIATNSWRKNFQKYKFFAENIAGKYFTKNIQKSFLKASAYGTSIGQKNNTDTESIEQDKKFYEELKKLPGFDSWGTKKEIKYLRSMLYEDEKVFAIASGIMDGNTILLTCTNKRVLFIDCGLIYGVHHTDIMLDKINSISFKNKLLLGDIYIQDAASVKVIKNVQKYSIKPFIDSVYKAIESKKKSEIPNINTGIADEILKLKQLLDMGIISSDEFEAQKNKLLKA